MRLFTLILSFFALSLGVQATHIVGGGFSLKWIAGDKYELRLRVLRDCENGLPPFNNPLYVGVYDIVTHGQMDVFTMTLLENETLNFVGLNCAQIPTGCTHVGSYKIEVTLPAAKYNNSAGYYFSWERCCRNNIIQNIIQPEDAGMTFYMEVPPLRMIKNSTPVWTSNPVTLLCKDNPFKYNMKFVDPDNDSLHYSLVEPIQGTTGPNDPNHNNDVIRSGPYTNIQWKNSYSNSMELRGNPPLTINPKTGELNVTPSETGIFVASILVQEFRFGKKLGEVRLELQFTVTNCLQNPFPVIVYTDTFGQVTPGLFSVEVPGKICFDVVSQDIKDSLYVDINGPLLDSNMVNKPVVSKFTSGLRQTTTRFCWQTQCSFAGMPPLTYTVDVRDNGCPIPKSAVNTFTILVRPMPVINSTDMLCMTLVDDKETILYYGDSTPFSKYFDHYQLYRSTDDLNYTRLDTMPDKSQREYRDPNTPGYNKINYSYFMRGINKCGVAGPPSDTLGTFEQLKYIPDQQKLITVTVDRNERLKIIWPKSWEKDFAQYFLYKGTREQTIDQFTQFYNTHKVTDTLVFDNDVNVHNVSACYYLMMKDTCGNFSPMGNRSCSIVLKGRSYPFEHVLDWQPYTFWESGTRDYDMYRRDTETPVHHATTQSGNTISWVDAELNRRSGKFWYQVVANEENGSDIVGGFNAESRSNEIELIQSPLLHVPNAFTLNSDGINDVWGIRDVFVKDYHLKVFNGWGQLVFETTDKYRQWDGQSENAVLQQSCVYVYLVTFTGWDESSHTRKGNVTVLR